MFPYTLSSSSSESDVDEPVPPPGVSLPDPPSASNMASQSGLSHPQRCPMMTTSSDASGAGQAAASLSLVSWRFTTRGRCPPHLIGSPLCSGGGAGSIARGSTQATSRISCWPRGSCRDGEGDTQPSSSGLNASVGAIEPGPPPHARRSGSLDLAGEEDGVRRDCGAKRATSRRNSRCRVSTVTSECPRRTRSARGGCCPSTRCTARRSGPTCASRWRE